MERYIRHKMKMMACKKKRIGKEKPYYWCQLNDENYILSWDASKIDEMWIKHQMRQSLTW